MTPVLQTWLRKFQLVRYTVIGIAAQSSSPTNISGLHVYSVLMHMCARACAYAHMYSSILFFLFLMYTHTYVQKNTQKLNYMKF